MAASISEEDEFEFDGDDGVLRGGGSSSSGVDGRGIAAAEQLISANIFRQASRRNANYSQSSPNRLSNRFEPSFQRVSRLNRTPFCGKLNAEDPVEYFRGPRLSCSLRIQPGSPRRSLKNVEEISANVIKQLVGVRSTLDKTLPK